MIVKRNKSVRGYTFKNFEGAPENTLVEIKPPEQVVIPLVQGYGSEVPALVKLNDHVKAGQILGRDDDTVSTPVHSSINGTVVGLKKIRYGEKDINTVVVKSDGTSETPGGKKSNWGTLSNAEIEKRLYTSGVTALGRSGIPTRFQSSVIGTADVEHIIVHGAFGGVYKTASFILSHEGFVKKLSDAIQILKKIMPQVTIHITIDTSGKETAIQVDNALGNPSWFKIHPMETRYPVEFDEVIIPILLDREYPYGYIPAHLGIITLNIQDMQYIYESVVEQKPLIERIVALCGPGFKKNHYIKARIGSPLGIIGELKGGKGENRYVADSLLTGASLTDDSFPLMRDFNSIIAVPENTSGGFLGFASPGFKKDSHTRTFVSSFLPIKRTVDTNLHGEERPCIFCGYCEDVCPVGIIPHLIYRNVERDKIEDYLVSYKIFNCIDCNLCTYVCPSKIRVSSYISEGKKKLRNIGFDESTVILPKFDLKGLDAEDDSETERVEGTAK